MPPFVDVERVESFEESWEVRSGGEVDVVSPRGVAMLPFARTVEVVGESLLVK